jgi:S-DNA-T family DNA segregation ATPase FtsK/SpoIIIE
MNNNSIKREIILIVLLALGGLYFLSLISHSYSENPFSAGIIPEKSVNYLGVFGAYLADFSLSTIGFSAYLLSFSLIILGVRYYLGLFLGVNTWLFLAKFITFLVFIVNNCALFNLIDVNYGGYLGEMVNAILVPLFASGVWFIYIIFDFLSLSFLLGISWIKLSSQLAKISTVIGIYGYRFIKIIGAGIAYLINLAQHKKITKKTSINPTIPKIKPKPRKTQKPIPASPSPTVVSSENKVLPSVDLLDDIPNDNISYSQAELTTMADNLTEELINFGIDATVVDIVPGPVITSFEIELPAGLKVSKVVGLDKDLARALLVQSVRIVDVIPGKHTIGIEIPNASRQMIALSEIIKAEEYTHSDAPLTMCLGKDTTGKEVVINLAKTPHLLVAGATGMGKSVGLNAMLMGILFKSKPSDVRLIMIDPKVVELAIYADIPHLLTPVVTDMHEASSVLYWCVAEMERRYALLAQFGVRNIASFNQKIRDAKEVGEPLLDPDFDAASAAEGESAKELEELALIVIVIDEYADMLGALAGEDRSKAKRTESFIIRIAQKARAAGMHLIIATQRPSTDVITGLIKSNIPSRVAFKVSTAMDSRIILDKSGAEGLLGMGDMLYMMPGRSHLSRVHGAFVSDGEISRVVEFLKQNYPTNYLDEVKQAEDEEGAEFGEMQATSGGEADPLYDEAVAFVLSSGKASISSVQRRLRIGYNRAARIIDDMEAAGLVSPMNANGSREILAPRN